MVVVEFDVPLMSILHCNSVFWGCRDENAVLELNILPKY